MRKRHRVCYECGATDYVKFFGDKELCEKCLFYYDVHEFEDESDEELCPDEDGVDDDRARNQRFRIEE